MGNEVGQAAAESDAGTYVMFGPCLRIVEKRLRRVKSDLADRQDASAEVLPGLLKNPAKYKMRAKLFSDGAVFFDICATVVFDSVEQVLANESSSVKGCSHIYYLINDAAAHRHGMQPLLFVI